MKVPRAAVRHRAPRDVARVVLGDPGWEEGVIVEKEKYLTSNMWIGIEDECVEPPVPVPGGQSEWWARGILVPREGE